MPARGAWSGFRLSIPDNTKRDQIGIVEHCAKGVKQRITEFTTFVY